MAVARETGSYKVIMSGECWRAATACRALCRSRSCRRPPWLTDRWQAASCMAVAREAGSYKAIMTGGMLAGGYCVPGAL